MKKGFKLLGFIVLAIYTAFGSMAVRAQEAKIGDVRRVILEKPVELKNGYGTSNLVVSTQLTGSAREQLQRYMQEGMLRYIGFHWHSAIRHFNMALKLEPSNPVALALKASSYSEINADASDIQELFRLALTNRSFPLDREDSAFIRYLFSKWNIPRRKGLSTWREIAEVVAPMADRFIAIVPFTKMDYLAQLGYNAFNIDALKKVIEREPLNPAANHFLVHLYENTQGNLAIQHARIYAEAAPESAHAQHMYGHILPQAGKWKEALLQFKKSHDLHVREMKSEGILPSEDWHYSHNIDLMTSTMVFLEDHATAAQLFAEACSSGTPSCQTGVALDILDGRYSSAGRKLESYYSNNLDHPTILADRILIAIGSKDMKRIRALVGSAQVQGEFDEETMLFARTAYEIIVKKSDPQTVRELFGVIAARLARPGFDRWSGGVLNSRKLMRVLHDNGHADLAEELKTLAISLSGRAMCM
ncbi:MAG: tetratricopeptide repeat protein [Bdellovibrionales bacterium]